MDGRDIGTTVFPNAELKIFMTADIAVRVERRFKEMYASNQNITIEEVRDNLEMRDYIDSHREISPLRKADECNILDNYKSYNGTAIENCFSSGRMKKYRCR